MFRFAAAVKKMVSGLRPEGKNERRLSMANASPSWRKLGMLFNAAGQYDWMLSGAALPVPEHLGGDLYRIYFSPRDAQNRSHIGYVVVDMTDPRKILDISAEPVVSPGALGAFDDSGCSMAGLVHCGGRKHLYYIGWNLGVTVPFRNSLGLLVADGDAGFKRYAPGPIMDRTPFEPHFLGCCCVMLDGGRWKMWYPVCTEWRISGGAPQHRYHIKYAESDNGVEWRRDGLVCIDYQDDAEYAISRPSVVRDGPVWKMWFAHRGGKYRIGYAESEDGMRWNRMDDRAGIDVSADGWDSEMMEYPFVFDHDGARYMLYNGNGYGGSGFGLAVLD